MNDKFGLALLTMFGIGRIKNAPGTFASLVTCVFYYFVFWLDVNFYLFIAIVSVVFVISIFLIFILSHHFKEKDPKEIVIDEFFGQSIPFLIVMFLQCMSSKGLWIAELKPELWYFIWSFVLFRFFDIWKPFPIDLIDRKMKNGFGVILDDVIAGIYASILLWTGFYGWLNLTNQI